MEERENVDREGFLRLVLNLKKKHEREEGNYYKDSFGLLNFYLYYLSFSGELGSFIYMINT